jgi:OOP family OmpA-OmpF porin
MKVSLRLLVCCSALFFAFAAHAQAVVGWLVANGIDSDRLTAKGFGQTKPVADSSTEEGRAKNRRVELVKQ